MKVALVWKFILFFSIFCTCSQWVQAAQDTSEITGTEFTVFGFPIDESDFVSNEPGITEIFRRGQRISPEEAMGKTALLQPRKTSPTGLMTLVPPSSPNAARSAIFIDGFPVLDPAGTGLDLNSLPIGFSDSFHFVSPFYPAPAGLMASGGILDIRLPKKSVNTVFHSSIAHYGSMKNSLLIPKGERLWGIQLENSTGKSPYSLSYKRELFSNKTTPSSPSHKFSLMSRGEKDLFILNMGRRKNPGALLNEPITGESTQKDFMALAGYNFKISNWTSQAALSASHLNNKTFPSGGSNWNTAVGSFISSKRAYKGTKGKGEVEIDHRIESYKSDAIKSKNRHLIGTSLSRGQDLDLGGKLDSSLRLESLLTSNSDSNRFAVSAGVGYKSDQGKSVKSFAGVTHIHRFPDLTALYGGNFDGFLINGNSSIPTEKQTSLSIGLEMDDEKTEMIAYPFITHIKNLHTYDSGLSKYTSKPEATMYGLVVDGTKEINQSKLRLSTVWTPYRKDENKNTLPFKPELVIGTSAESKFLKSTSFTLSHTYKGVRTVSGGPNLKSFNNFTLRFDQKFSEDIYTYFKVDNLLNEGAENFPGYPMSGRTFYIGTEMNI